MNNNISQYSNENEFFLHYYNKNWKNYLICHENVCNNC